MLLHNSIVRPGKTVGRRCTEGRICVEKRYKSVWFYPGAAAKAAITLACLPPEGCIAILLVSSAIPAYSPPKPLTAINMWTGGVRCNIPVEALARKGYDLIIAVLLSNDASFYPCQFPRESVLPLFPHESLGSFIKGTLDFQGMNTEECIKRGYEHTLNAFETRLKVLANSIDLDQLQDIAKAQREHWQFLQEQTPKPKIERMASQIRNFLLIKKEQ